MRFFTKTAKPSTFSIVRRGYDCTAVDQFLADLDAVAAAGERLDPKALRAQTFPVAAKAYDRAEVARHLETLAIEAESLSPRQAGRS